MLWLCTSNVTDVHIHARVIMMILACNIHVQPLEAHLPSHAYTSFQFVVHSRHCVFVNIAVFIHNSLSLSYCYEGRALTESGKHLNLH